MNVSPRRKKWVITQEALDQLLAQLHSDSQRAGEQYEKIRQRLVKFFQWRGCALAEECADKTFDRVAQKITEGTRLWNDNPYSYFHGVAINILREYWRDHEQQSEPLEDVEPSEALSEDPQELMMRELERLKKERLLECLNRCLQKLPPESLHLITKYHQGEESDKVRRKDLAQMLDIPLGALRLRAYRIRAIIEKCIEDCLKRRPEI